MGYLVRNIDMMTQGVVGGGECKQLRSPGRRPGEGKAENYKEAGPEGCVLRGSCPEGSVFYCTEGGTQAMVNESPSMGHWSEMRRLPVSA